MKGKSRNSFSIQLLAFFMIGSFVPVMIMGSLTLWLTNSSLRVEVEKSSINELENIALNVELVSDTYTQIIQHLASDENITDLLRGKTKNLQYGYSRLYTLASGHTQMAQIHIIDVLGDIRMTTGMISEDYNMPEMADWGILRKAAVGGGMVCAAVDKSRDYNSDIAFALAQAIHEEGKIIGFVVAEIFRLKLAEMIQPDIGANSNIFLLVDRQGYVLFNLFRPAEEGLEGVFTFLEQTTASEKGYFYHTEMGEYPRLVSYILLPELGFRAVQVAPSVAVKNTMESIRNIIFGICGVLLLFLPILAIGLTRRIWKPVGELTQAMRRVRHEQDYTIRVSNNRNDEIGELSQSFNKMLADTQALIYNIEAKQQALRVAQMRSLQAQVKPHFIYNTLDIIKWSAKMNDTQVVADLCVQLAKLLRATIAYDDELVSVAEELEILYAYTAIQQKRFGNRMELSFKIQEEILQYKIPKLILQPIVENAIAHGLEERLHWGKLEITGIVHGEYLHFTVQDNGVGIAENMMKYLMKELEKLDYSSPKQQIGIRNVHMRARLYGDEHCGLFLESKPGIGTKARIVLHCLEGKEDNRHDEGSGY